MIYYLNSFVGVLVLDATALVVLSPLLFLVIDGLHSQMVLLLVATLSLALGNGFCFLLHKYMDRGKIAALGLLSSLNVQNS